jgi:hypothetical protein
MGVGKFVEWKRDENAGGKGSVRGQGRRCKDRHDKSKHKKASTVETAGKRIL